MRAPPIPNRWPALGGAAASQCSPPCVFRLFFPLRHTPVAFSPYRTERPDTFRKGMSMKRPQAIYFAVLLALAAVPAHAQTIYPLNRAEFLAGARFDLKVEFPVAPEQ